LEREKKLQIELEMSEFAYLCRMLDAEKVVGADNERLFPADPEAQQELLATGLQQLQAHEWLTADEEGRLTTNQHLVMLVAVVCSPDLVFTATRYGAEDRQQTISYFVAGPYLVELFQTDNDGYLLSRLPEVGAVLARWEALFATGAAAADPISLQLEGTAFAAARREAERGEGSVLARQLAAAGVSPAARAELVERLARLSPHGKIEGAAVRGTALHAFGTLLLLQDDQGGGWLAQSDPDGDLLTLTQQTPATLRTIGRQLFAAVAAPV